MPNQPPMAPANINAPDKDVSHNWVVSATISVDEARARRALKYQSYLTREGERVRALEVYCSGCRRNIADVPAGAPCPAKVNNRHLIGGDQDHRKKRRKAAQPNPDRITVMPGPRINRRGINAVISGEA